MSESESCHVIYHILRYRDKSAGFPFLLENSMFCRMSCTSCVRITSYTNPVIMSNQTDFTSQPFIESILDRIEKLSIHTMKETQASILYKSLTYYFSHYTSTEASVQAFNTSISSQTYSSPPPPSLSGSGTPGSSPRCSHMFRKAFRFR